MRLSCTYPGSVSGIFSGRFSEAEGLAGLAPLRSAAPLTRLAEIIQSGSSFMLTTILRGSGDGWLSTFSLSGTTG